MSLRIFLCFIYDILDIHLVLVNLFHLATSLMASFEVS